MEDVTEYLSNSVEEECGRCDRVQNSAEQEDVMKYFLTVHKRKM